MSWCGARSSTVSVSCARSARARIDFYQLETRPEVRQCRLCDRQVRLRSGTMLEHSKLPILTWLRALFLVTQDKRGISALSLTRLLSLGSYRTGWRMLHKIREAMRQRDDNYLLKGLIELDGAQFQPEAHSGDTTDVLVAVESKEWRDERGKLRAGAGFAKVVVARETTIFAQRFVDWAVTPGAQVNTDADPAYHALKNVDHDARRIGGCADELNRWLPWVHKFIANAKTWLLGTHHGVNAKYLGRYLAEYTYRFNRRHDPDALMHRTLVACVHAKPVRLPVLCA